MQNPLDLGKFYGSKLTIIAACTQIVDLHIILALILCDSGPPSHEAAVDFLHSIRQSSAVDVVSVYLMHEAFTLMMS